MSTSNFTPHNLIKEKKQSWTHLSKYHRRETIISNQIAHLTICLKNTSGTAGGPGGPDRTLTIKRRSFPEVVDKQKTEEKKEKKRDWTRVITMAKLCMAHASMHGANKPPGPKETIMGTNLKIANERNNN